MELRMCQFRWHGQFRGIAWNCKELGVSMTRAVPWNSMELGVCQIWWYEQFHGIPWNLECAQFDDTSSSMEFHGIPKNLEWTTLEHTIHWISRNFECANLSDNIPCNSMELWLCQRRWHQHFHGIPWNIFVIKNRNFEDVWILMGLEACIIPIDIE